MFVYSSCITATHNRLKPIRQYWKSISLCPDTLPDTPLDFIAYATSTNAQRIHTNPQTRRQRPPALNLDPLLTRVIPENHVAVQRIQFARAMIEATQHLLSRFLFDITFGFSKVIAIRLSPDVIR